MMHRRTFIKGILFSLPTLCLQPLTKLVADWGDAPASLPEKGLGLFFIGDYGRRVQAQFSRLAAMEPVLYPCRHVPHQDALRMQVVTVGKDFVWNRDVLAAICRETAIIVYDERLPHERALANGLCRLINKARKGGLTIGMGPFAACQSYDTKFDLTLQTWQNQIDCMPYVLRTFYKTYCGCGGLGNLLCLKVQLQDVLHAGGSRGILLGQKTFDHSEQIMSSNAAFSIPSRFKKPFHNEPFSLVWHIVEMHHTEPEPLKVLAGIADKPLSGCVDRLILPHMSLAAKAYRETVFGF